MYTLFYILIFILAFAVLVKLIRLFSGRIKFYTTGFDSGFRFSQIGLLWSLAKTAKLENPQALFWSVPAIDRSIASVIKNAKIQKKEQSAKTQKFLENLYAYRTKLELDPKNKKGMQSTKLIANGQKLRLVLKNHGVFSSTVLNNGRELVIALPLKNKVTVFRGQEWVGKQVSVYFQRQGDAAYVFDSLVRNVVQFNSSHALYLAHSENLLRTQKRSSVRCECSIAGHLYISPQSEATRLDPEIKDGFKCLIEDISESGALIRVGGQGRSNLQLKLQFILSGKTIVMYGAVKCVEYNMKLNQSRLHFQCLDIGQTAKNNILSYVYKVLPQDQKDVLDAIRQTGEDAAALEYEKSELIDEIIDKADEVDEPTDLEEFAANPIENNEVKYEPN